MKLGDLVPANQGYVCEDADWFAAPALDFGFHELRAQIMLKTLDQIRALPEAKRTNL